MQYRNVGKAGIKVSEIALGSWMTRLEDTAAVENAAQIVRKAWEAGVNFFDCADAYSGMACPASTSWPTASGA